MGALEGLKVLDFTTLLPGPYATMMLADLGAEVLKITSRSKPDIVRDFPPFIEGLEAQACGRISANEAWLGRNKKSMFLNLKMPEAVKIVKQLVLEYDIVIEQFRPGVMDRLGIGYEDLKEVNPAIIYCALTGYGQTGPLKHKAGHDINYLARSGNMAHAGRKETGPVLTDIQIADVAVGSMNSMVGILAAVHHRHNTGEGQFVDVAMLDGLIPFNAMEGASFLVNDIEPERENQRLNGGCLYDFYETKDGQYLSVGSLEPQFFQRFCMGIGCPDLIEGTVLPDHVQVVKDRICKVIKEKTRQEWITIFQDLDACVEPVLSLEESLIQDEQIQYREMVVDVSIPLSNGRKVTQLGNPIKLSKCPVEYKHAAYPVGFHTEEILRKLGYTKEELESLME